MGMLIDGKWQASADNAKMNARFKRKLSAVTAQEAVFLAKQLSKDPPPILVVSQSCPWSHRATLVRALKGLGTVPTVIAGGPRTQGYMLPKANPIFVGNKQALHLHQLYSTSDQYYTGRATVPVLWDSQSQSILCNDSAIIARALDTVSSDWKIAPKVQANDIDALNSQLFDQLANAVYCAGFATSQLAYETAVKNVFCTLEWLESHLTHQRCLFGQQITEADLFLFATLVRFDSVYVPLFRCTRRRLVDYSALWAYARDIYSLPGVSDTIDLVENLNGYFLNDTDNNPHGIMPELPEINWATSHGRDTLGPLTVWKNGRQIPYSRDMSLTNAR